MSQPFHLKRRQHFLSEERWQYIQKDLPDSLTFYQERKKSEVFGKKAVFYFNVVVFWLDKNVFRNVITDIVEPINKDKMISWFSIWIFWYFCCWTNSSNGNT